MDGQATACWISPLAREANWIASPQQHPGDIIFSSSTGRSFAQATKACICGFCVIVWAPVSIGGLAIRIQDKSIRDHHGPWRGPRAACQPVALPRCSGSSLPRVPSVRHPRSVALHSRSEGTRAGPFETCPELRETDDINQRWSKSRY